MKTPALVLCLALMGCATGPSYELAAKSLFTEANHHAGDQLVSKLKTQINPTATVLVGTLSSIDRSGDSSRFGRLVSEQIATRLSNRGFNVVEMKLRGTVEISPAGAVVLSDNVKDLVRSYEAQMVIAGTYAVADQYVYLTLKAINPADNRILSAHNYTLPINENNAALLGIRTNTSW